MEKAEADRILLARGWLSRQPKPHQAIILRRGRVLSFKRGEHAYSVGDPSGGIYGVLEGGFGIEAATVHAEPRLGHIARSGMWLGSRPLNTGLPRVLTMRALEPGFAMNIPLAALNEILASDPSAHRMMASLAEEASILSIHVVSDLLLRSSEGRIAAVLLRISGVTVRDAVPPPHYACVTQSELGEMANVSREVANRVLGQLEARGLIAVGHGRIDILHAKPLVAFAYKTKA